MSSKKMVFSLVSLITILAPAFVVPTAMAEVLGKDFKTTISLQSTSATDGTGQVIGDNVVTTGDLSLKVVFDKLVADGEASTGTTGDGFDVDDVIVAALNKATGVDMSVTVGDPAVAGVATGATSSTMYTVELTGISGVDADNPAVILVTIAAGAVKNNDPADVVTARFSADDSLGTNAKGALQFDVVTALAATDPKTVSVTGQPLIVLGPDTHEAFSFTVTLSEKPKEFKKDHIDVANATVSGDPIALPAKAEVNDGDSTEASNRVYPYLVTLKPKYETEVKDDGSADIVIKIKPFEDTSTPPNKSLLSMAYRVKVNSDANKKVGLSGTEKVLPKDVIIPKDGYLVVAKDVAMSLITNPGDPKHGAADIARRDKVNKQTYNLVAVDLGIDLEGFFIRSGTIDLVSPDAGLYISEIMWGTDAGSPDRQWIEIANTSGKEIPLGDKTHKLVLYEANEPLPDTADAANKIVDRVSTLYKGTNHWWIAGKGQSGQTEILDVGVFPTVGLISMERVMTADGTYADGTMASSWGQSTVPSQNFTDAAGSLFVGSPGTAPITPVEIVPPEPEPTPARVAIPEDIMITEIMVDTGDGRLPQWIELTNVSGAEVSLAGWSLQITNSGDDDKVIGSSVSIDLSGTLGVGGGEDAGGTMGKSLLLVTGATRSSANLAGSTRVVDVSSQLDQRGRYTLISMTAFMIALIPPQATGILTYGDMAGNLKNGWDIPVSEGSRSSLIRREVLADGMATMGTSANGWILASSTPLVTGPTTWYGSDEDAGTPGYDAGGPLPVELSHFRPARDKQTGAVVITWATQSELNNAGFFIKRSQQRNGQFKVVNPTLIPGAGTTSEKQFYTYTDTTAQPNVVYYYQIEDISLDGNRQTLTRGIRLKGHIGAAGKLTTTWGDLKTSHEE